ncbi:MAG TPA: S8 family serine peptidase, partial [Flavisolibacter sp.]|nr:S8 family serine peptidase [Flavisolibacter sp.]
MNEATFICPLCQDRVDQLLFQYHQMEEQVIINQIKKLHPEWAREDGLCSRCLDYFQVVVLQKRQQIPDLGPYFPVRSLDDFLIIPTAIRLQATPTLTGKGVTICFIDSGFYLHPDLTTKRNRIRRVLDLTETHNRSYFAEPHPESWHGCMTTTVCAGDGFLSGGLYKGIASDAELVLLKVQNEEGHISSATIEKALAWVLKNHLKYNIRIVNISLGDDQVISYKKSRIDQLAEELIARGVILVAAAGNDEKALSHPPANSPNVITVGGVHDRNDLKVGLTELYHSTYGQTIDGFMKPDLLAPAMWIAAPILPGTREAKEAALLHHLSGLKRECLWEELSEQISQTGLDPDLAHSLDEEMIHEAIKERIRQTKFFARDYMHVDGTSFAAPIVCSIIAQLLELRPDLTPAAIRHILYSTAIRLPQYPAERQGYGVVQPQKALEALQNANNSKYHFPPRLSNGRIEFWFEDPEATTIKLAGSFNNWTPFELNRAGDKPGLWRAELPQLPRGRYLYKFFVDEQRWVED